MRSRRKRLTTPLSLPRWKSIDLAQLLAASVAVGFFFLSLFSPVFAGDLGWGRPGQESSAGFSDSGNPLRTAQAEGLDQSESNLIAAAWEEDDALAAELEEPIFDETPPLISTQSDIGEDKSENPLHTVDPFEADDRIAQLVKDPFDEPLEGPIPPLDTDLDEIEEALDRERARREKAEKESEAALESDVEKETVNMEETLDDDDFDKNSTLEQEESIQIRRNGAPKSEFNFDLKVPNAESNSQRPSQFRDRRLETDRSAEDQKNCEEELAAAKADKVSSVDLNIRVEGIAGEDYPYECAFGNEPMQPRSWSEITYNWKASALCHKPLYFEQDQLERYGHSWGPYVQPIMSGVHFFTSVPILPYKMGIESPNECIYALGHYRPGDCAPYMIEPVPFTCRAAFYQAGFVTGAAFAIP
ncbi:hypothetical protein Pr1d_38010 [Bythopirellula goksoeyrii]|uniref:Uncharacterized protein n=1 Tax=Bythopirellula goksoeyrii TaxID=1400387 RepID=A0A5B9QBQ9_9BACT|nr:hypothetical protein Pr1d_38010 [Bythopirellula goksoeyrii]